jgi:hypothetical protein
VVLLGTGAAGLTTATAASSNPCDSATLPMCVPALGPLVDVTTSWQSYQPALMQPVPISDYGGDPEDAPPPLGVGVCGGEAAHPPPPIPASTQAAALPPPAPGPPPGDNTPFSGSHYCQLRYLATDFDPLCDGCVRVLVDYSAIPTGNATSPGADGHWAARFNAGSDFTPTMPFNAHSPNVKNLCSDKSAALNTAPGSGCVAALAQFDEHALELEGDSSIFHHFPFEGRYFNGPGYLAGDGAHVPYHWVHGAYFDLNLGGAAGLPVWYSVGYRGIGNPTPDTDSSYGCLCEVPPAGQSAFSPTFQVGSAVNPPTASGSGSNGGGSPGGRLPNTSPPAPAGYALLLAGTVLGLLLALLGAGPRLVGRRR